MPIVKKTKFNNMTELDLKYYSPTDAKPVLQAVLSLFDGISCGRIALERAGYEVRQYFASEIKPHAIKCTQSNYPDTIQLGSVLNVKVKSLRLSDVYSYICNYDINLQSNISEWEVLYWLNKNFTFSAKISTQKPNERQEVSEPSIVQRIEEVWFSNREMGSVRKFGDDTRSGRAKKNSFIDEIVRELCGWNETDGIAQDYWNILRLHKEEQVTVVEYEGGYHIFKGKIDLCIGGSPCKGISRLNKNQEGLEHAESKLFWEYVRLLEEVKPKYFLLENTHGNKEATEIITETLGVKPISINSKLVSAQNRPRYYWTNIPGVKQPKDKGITTADVFDYSGELVDECRVKWLTSESGKKSMAKGYTRVNPYPKSGCLTANGHKKWNENYLLKDGVYRHLSQTEIERLQTLPIGYTKKLSYDEAYDCIGDGWTVDIIAHILSFAEWS